MKKNRPSWCLCFLASQPSTVPSQQTEDILKTRFFDHFLAVVINILLFIILQGRVSWIRYILNSSRKYFHFIRAQTRIIMNCVCSPRGVYFFFRLVSIENPCIYKLIRIERLCTHTYIHWDILEILFICFVLCMLIYIG